MIISEFPILAQKGVLKFGPLFQKRALFRAWLHDLIISLKLDKVGPIDNKPSTD